MGGQENVLIKGVRQALYYVSRGKSIPEENALLQSPLVSHSLHEKKLPNTVDYREEVAVQVLKQLMNEYGQLQSEGRRQQVRQKIIFEMLYNLLQGRPGKAGVSDRSYERYHAQGVRMLAKMFHRKQEQLLQKDSRMGSPKELREARQHAQSISCQLDKPSSSLDLYAVRELTETASIIEDHHCYGEAGGYFGQIRSCLQSGPHNLVVLEQRALATNRLAHCLMTQDELSEAIAYFGEVTSLATELRDWELWIHGTHMLGVTYNTLGDWQSGLDNFNTALTNVTKGSNYRYRRAWIQRDIISALIKKGDFKEIPTLATKSLSTREELGDDQGCMMTLEIWGRALIAQQKHEQAEAKLREALNIGNSVSSSLFHTMLWTTRAQLCFAWGKFAEGVEYMGKAKETALQFGMWHQLNKLMRLAANSARSP